MAPSPASQDRTRITDSPITAGDSLAAASAPDLQCGPNRATAGRYGRRAAPAGGAVSRSADNNAVRGERVRCQATTGQGHYPGGPGNAGDFGNQPRLANPGFAHHCDPAACACPRRIAERDQRRELAIAADDLRTPHLTTLSPKLADACGFRMDDCGVGFANYA